MMNLDEAYRFIREDDHLAPELSGPEDIAEFVNNKVAGLYGILEGQREEEKREAQLMDFPAFRWIRILTRKRTMEIVQDADELDISNIDSVVIDELEGKLSELRAVCESRGVRRINSKWMVGALGDRPANAIVQWINRKKDIKDQLWKLLQKRCLDEGIELVLGNLDEIPRTKEEEKAKLMVELEEKFPKILEVCERNQMKSVTISWLKHRKGEDSAAAALYNWTNRKGEFATDLWGRLAELLAEKGITLEMPGVEEKKDTMVRLADFSRYLNTMTVEWTPKEAVRAMPTQTRTLISKLFGARDEEGILWSEILKSVNPNAAELFYYKKPLQDVLDKYPAEERLYIDSRRRKIIRGLRQVLMKKDPEVFNVQWIKDHAGSLITIMNTLRSNGENVRWVDLIKECEDDWIERFSPMTMVSGQSRVSMKVSLISNPQSPTE